MRRGRSMSPLGGRHNKQVYKNAAKFAQALMVEAEQKLPMYCKEIQIGIAFAFYSGIVLGTPVLTGRARTNWFTTISSPSVRTIDAKQEIEQPGTWHSVQGEPLTGEELARILPTLQLIRSKPLGEVVYIANRLSYITALENGHSGQAPGGMVELSKIGAMSVPVLFKVQQEAIRRVHG